MLLLALIFGTSCPDAKEAAEAGPVRVPITVMTDEGPVTFQAEVADSPDERQRGLMFRTELGAREGMLFLFPVERQLSFWMKNTLIPLDMIFIRSDRTVLGVVHRAKPETLTSRRVPGFSQFVLEVAGGTAESLGIRSGQKVRFMVPPPDR